MTGSKVASDEPLPTKGVNPNPPPRRVLALLRIVSIALVLVGIALIPSGSASLGIALMALSLTLYGGVTASDEPMPYHPVNPPPPPHPFTLQRLLHILSVLAGAVGLYLIVRRSGFDTGTTLIAAGFAVNVIDLALNAKRYGPKGVAQ